jgi:nucleoside-diphosphate-sugar epimerase
VARCIVTGAAGFIGSALAANLRASGHAVVAIDRAFTDEANIDGGQSTADGAVVSTDILVAGPDIWRGADVVFHLAGRPGLRPSWESPFTSYPDDNVAATQHMLDAAVEAGVPRVIYASSSSIYSFGDAPGASRRVAPASPYGVSKLAGELMCDAYRRRHGLDVIVLRYFSVYGPGQRPDMAFHRIIDAALTGATFPMHGNGSQERDFTYVGDVVDATVRAGLVAPTIAEPIDIGNGQSTSLKQAIAIVEELTGREVRVEATGGDFGEPCTRADPTDAARSLGWRATTLLPDGLSLQVERQVNSTQRLHG